MKRIIAVGDIHGCNNTFRELLMCLRLKKRDTLYLLGDLIDRGPDSKGVIETILKLQHDGYDVRGILGNHEDMLLRAIETDDEDDLFLWLENGGQETLNSYSGITSPHDIPETHISFLNSLPLYFTTRKHVLVHAGLDFQIENPFSEDGREAMLWHRRLTVEPDKMGGKKLVVGHTIMDINKIIESLDSNLIKLDNGCFMGKLLKGKGSLVAMDLNSGELFIQENIEGN